MTRWLLVGLAASLSLLHDHTQTQHTRQNSSGRVISQTQRPLPDNIRQSQQTDIHASAAFESVITGSKRPQTDAFDRAASAINIKLVTLYI